MRKTSHILLLCLFFTSPVEKHIYNRVAFGKGKATWRSVKNRARKLRGVSPAGRKSREEAFRLFLERQWAHARKGGKRLALQMQLHCVAAAERRILPKITLY
jgi:hypothetical protein